MHPDRARSIADRVRNAPGRAGGIVRTALLGKDSNHGANIAKGIGDLGHGVVSAFDQDEFGKWMIRKYTEALGHLIGHGINHLRERLTAVKVHTDITSPGIKPTLDSALKASKANAITPKNIGLSKSNTVLMVISMAMDKLKGRASSPEALQTLQGLTGKHPTYYPRPRPDGPGR